MNNTKLTNILLIILLVFNVAFIGKWWMGHQKFHHQGNKEAAPDTMSPLHDRSKAEIYLVKTLALDTAQQKKLDNILATHYTIFDKYMAANIRNQTNFFNALKNTPDSATALRCIDSLAIIKIAMEKELYFHLLSIKNICNSGQQKQYNELIDNMSLEFVHHHNFSGSPKPKHDTL